MQTRGCANSDWIHQFLPASCKTLKTSEIVFILLITIIREETLIKVHTMMRPYGEASRRKHKTSNKDQRQVFFSPSLHTPDNCVRVFHSITSLCHRRGNVNQQYGNCVIMKAVIIIKVQPIIPEGGKIWSVASCCSCNDQDFSSPGGKRGFNCSQVWVSFAAEAAAARTGIYFSALGDLTGEKNDISLVIWTSQMKCQVERYLYPVEKQTFLLLFPLFFEILCQYPVCNCISTHLLSTMHV